MQLLERETERAALGEGLYHSAHLECQDGPIVKLVCGLEAPITDARRQCPPGDQYCVVCTTPPIHCPVCGAFLRKDE